MLIAIVKYANANMLLAVVSYVYDVTPSVHDVSNRISFTQMLIHKGLRSPKSNPSPSCNHGEYRLSFTSQSWRGYCNSHPHMLAETPCPSPTRIGTGRLCPSMLLLR